MVDLTGRELGDDLEGWLVQLNGRPTGAEKVTGLSIVARLTGRRTNRRPGYARVKVAKEESKIEQTERSKNFSSGVGGR